MPQNIEDYALISDCHTAALIGTNGSIDWLCLPRYDSESVFGALLGDKDHGRWKLAPDDPGAVCTRRYDGDTFILVTRWKTHNGEVEVTEFMPHGDGRADLVRRVRGLQGSVTMEVDLRFRFGYATAMPWVRQLRDGDAPGIIAVAGPDAVALRGLEIKASNHSHRGEFTVSEGDIVDITMTWFPSHRSIPPMPDVDKGFKKTHDWWTNWASKVQHEGPYYDEVIRSLLVLRALTHEETGGIVAAATTSLPEQFGGERNWDYRFVWLRDAALTLESLLLHSYTSEAANWRAWLLRAIAGDPADVQIMYGLAGERNLAERDIESLPGYRGASPVRVGNAAVDQFQADVIGEVMVALDKARKAGLDETDFSWPLQRALVGFVCDTWDRPDQGIWEIRGPARYFTQGRVMVWAALDRAISAVRDDGLDGPVEDWEKLRDKIREEIEEKGFDKKLGSYTQYYGSGTTDASLLVLPQVGYCDYDDPRMLSTVAAIEKELLVDGLLLRYRTEENVDGLPPGENPFLACSFWLVEQYAHSNRLDEARKLMDRLVSYCSETGLLSEEVDPRTGHHVGNTPQAFSHLTLLRAADAITRAEKKLKGEEPQQGEDTGGRKDHGKNVNPLEEKSQDYGDSGGPQTDSDLGDRPSGQKHDDTGQTEAPSEQGETPKSDKPTPSGQGGAKKEQAETSSERRR
ncbi:Glucoamylase (glucan-1,4-alpha-glucosidase), GH15 family [Paramicrobacterium humi]|uniref:Glucoamylase (Glucan-1,4-alpha-glucosidase), GH15 family n=1 Tax=Paramicrobacterium humi TaxID=640635 RepID=A0A1H4MBB0_9MICO|nr:Glucoamylase (glucan-1,4-alpha-glucosidase), GH15 family [Microbacterium humi]